MNFNPIKNLTLPNKIIFLSCSFLIFYSIIIYFIIFPVTRDIKDIRKNIITQKIDLENKTVRQKNLNTLNEKLKMIEPELQKFNQIFINKNRELEFITTLENIANKNQLSQKINFDPNNAVLEQDHQMITINLALTGNFNNLMNYLQDIEELPYYVNINQINISTGYNVNTSPTDQSANQNKNINCNITANTYWK